MEKFKKFIWSTEGYLLIVGLICFFAFLGFIGASWLIENHAAKKVSSQVNSQSNQAAEQKQTAVNSNANALNYSIERKIEDRRRAEVILPKLEAARNRSQNSKSQVEKLTRELQDNEKNLHNSNADRAANCRQLANLFPNEKFEYCKS